MYIQNEVGGGVLYPFFLAALDGGGQSTPRLGRLPPLHPPEKRPSTHFQQITNAKTVSRGKSWNLRRTKCGIPHTEVY